MKKVFVLGLLCACMLLAGCGKNETCSSERAFLMNTFKAVIIVQLLVGCFQMFRIEKHQ